MSRGESAAAWDQGMYRLGCGCRVELRYGVVWAFWWKVVHRCRRHPSDPIPVRSMRLV